MVGKNVRERKTMCVRERERMLVIIIIIMVDMMMKGLPVDLHRPPPRGIR